MGPPPRSGPGAPSLTADLGEIRLATLGKGRKRLARFGAHQPLLEDLALARHLRADPSGIAHQRLGVLQRAERPLRQCVSSSACLGTKIRERHDGIGKTDGDRSLGLDRFTQREHRIGARIADPLRQQVGRGRLRHQRQIDERRDQPRGRREVDE
ncbi:hypothetical protein chiPu_0033912, partial [Chiloscyllium punctatum]|nr:hypothetical protein [Chiloscyllium punctatum]